MERIKVDLLVAGDLLSTSYMSCCAEGNIYAFGDRVNLDVNNPPSEIECFGLVFDISGSVIVKAHDDMGAVRVGSLLALKDKVVAVTGNARSLELGTIKKI